jgi:hypothetical protein
MHTTIVRASQDEVSRRQEFVKLFHEAPIPDKEILNYLGLFVNRQTMSRFLFMHHLYQQVIDVHGVVMEFGVRWGQSLALWTQFRGIYEPFNRTRKIIGFDTFEGFPSVHAKDGADAAVVEGAYSVSKGYESYLEQVLAYHESEAPIAHLRKFELVKGDGTVKVKEYLERHPETVVSLAYFDFDLYEPTKACLEAIKPHITKGTVIGFDEVCLEDFPGETVAVREALGIDKYRLRRTPFSAVASYIVVE